MKHDIFKTNPNLEKVFVTSDNEYFYQENDAKNHAKSLKDKSVETVYNAKTFEAIDDFESSEDDKELAEFEAAEKAKAESLKAEIKEDVAKPNTEK
ncbi:MAG: hypothetical protein RLZZ292_1049 [Bacteroidota bacterium]|jgi:hypothetical protein